MCDSWMSLKGLSIINFMVYWNGMMFFHKLVDSTGHNHDGHYIFGVTIILLLSSLLLPPRLMLMCIYVFFVGDKKAIIELDEEHIV
jgi:hypothetical protein